MKDGMNDKSCSYLVYYISLFTRQEQLFVLQDPDIPLLYDPAHMISLIDLSDTLRTALRLTVICVKSVNLLFYICELCIAEPP